MLAEAIKEIRRLCLAADGIELVDVPDLRKLAVTAGGTLELYDKPPPLRGASLAGIEDVVSMALDTVVSPDPEIYVSASSVLVLMDRSERLSYAKMTLHPSEQHATVDGLKKRCPLGVREMLRLLRHDLADLGEDVHTLESALARVQFDGSRSLSVDSSHGRESMGRSVVAAISNAEQIPREIRLDLHLWSDLGVWDASQISVRCRVHVDVEAEEVSLLPCPDEMPRAILTAQARVRDLLGDRLAERKIPVWSGSWADG